MIGPTPRQPGQVRSFLTQSGVDRLADELAKLPEDQRAELCRGILDHDNYRRAILHAGTPGAPAPVAGPGVRVHDQQDRSHQLAGEWLRCVMAAPRGMAAAFTSDETVRRALSTSGADGYLIPTFVGALLQAPAVQPALYPHVTRIPVKSNTGWIPVNAADLLFNWGDEAAEIDELDPTIGRVTFETGKMSGIIRASNEWADDSIDAINFVMGVFAQAAADTRDKAIAIGSGNGQPVGLLSASGAGRLHAKSRS